MDWENQQGGNLDLTAKTLDLGNTGTLRLIDHFADAAKEYLWDDKKPYLELNPQKCTAHVFQIVD